MSGPRSPTASMRSKRSTTRSPGLATVLVGDDPASHVYVGNKIKACEEAGIRSFHHGLDADVSQADLLDPDRQPERRRRRGRDPRPDAAARRARPGPGRRGHRLRQGRRRPDRHQRRAPRAGQAEHGAVHAARDHGASRRGGDRGERCERRGRRPLDPGRPPDGRASHQRQRDRHRLPLAHPRPRLPSAGAPTS